MKNFLLGIAFFFAIILTSCTSISTFSPRSFGSCTTNLENLSVTNLLRETWLCQINLNVNRWTQNVDPWFLTGQPNDIERADLKASCDSAVTHMSVKIPDSLTNIQVNGGFQVQIVGGQKHNSLYILGPNAGARRVAVEAERNKLLIYETIPTKNKPCGPNESTAPVIVRIGVKNLRMLSNVGCGHVYGRNIDSSALFIRSGGRGNIYLIGNMNLVKVVQTGSGAVVVLGANTPQLTIKALGRGSVNISGRVGIQCIVNQGAGAVRILGADTDSLIIRTSGRTRTSVVGYANVKDICARECSRVYLYWVNACNTNVRLFENARVGLAGVTQNLNLVLEKNTRFWGTYLQTDTIFIQAKDHAHANIAPNKKLFAKSTDNSSIYYYGRPVDVSQFGYGHGIVLPVLSNANCAPPCGLPAGRPTCSTGQCFK